MQSQPYVEVAKVAAYEYATSKCARDAPSRAGGDYELATFRDYAIIRNTENEQFQDGIMT